MRTRARLSRLYLVMLRADNYNCVCIVTGGIATWPCVRGLLDRAMPIPGRVLWENDSVGRLRHAPHPDVCCFSYTARAKHAIMSAVRLVLPTVEYVDYRRAAGMDGLQMLVKALVEQHAVNCLSSPRMAGTQPAGRAPTS